MSLWKLDDPNSQRDGDLRRGDVRGGVMERARALLRRGEIIAIDAPDGFQYVCDATNAGAVARLRARTRRATRPFVLIARDVDIVRRWCIVSRDEERELNSSPAPIVVLPGRPGNESPKQIAPGLATLGFRLPSAAPYVLLLNHLDVPLVMTAGDRRGDIASHLLEPGREAGKRLNDGGSPATPCAVVRFMDGEPRVLRPGPAPVTIDLPEGFEGAPDILAMGGERDVAFCLVKDGQAILSLCHGDLGRGHPGPDAPRRGEARRDDPAERTAFDEYIRNLAKFRDHYAHEPCVIVADPHPDYRSATLARSMPRRLAWVQHHHAHIASCLCENACSLDTPAVLGIALDGSGWGSDGTIWGGEFLLANYHGFRRLAALKPVAMPGEAQATREPWRNLYAHIAASMGWDRFATEFAALDSHAMLAAMPHRTLQAMIARGISSPAAASCGRLFDAVAAALNLGVARQFYDGEAAARLEAIADRTADAGAERGTSYPFTLSSGSPRFLDPAPMWRALFSDLAAGTPAATVAARFHDSFARALADTATELSRSEEFRTVALSGDCFGNRLLFEQTTRHLTAAGFVVLSHARVPCNDAGLALGQAAVAAARLLPRKVGRRNVESVVA